MFSAETYIDRRRRLKHRLKSGIILFLGNEQSPMNYPDNPYAFRQDSSFLYFWGIDYPGLSAIIDIDRDEEIVFGREETVEDIIWAGKLPSLVELCRKSGVREHLATSRLEVILKEAVQKGCFIHFLPQYRPENLVRIRQLLGWDIAAVNRHCSTSFIRGVVAQRSIKTEEEIQQIEAAFEVTHDMHTLAMKISKPGMFEFETVGAMTGLAHARNLAMMAYPIIFTTRGHVLHNTRHDNVMKAGDLVVNDSGCESPMHYASDITRTFPVGGRFTQKQKDIYTIVLNVQKEAMDNIRAGIEYRQVHFIAAKQIVTELKALGLMRGDVASAVAAGAHALFFPHGLGHMLGLDVHDMENLGEYHVGYTETIQRSDQFGLRYLRLARRLEAGFVVTVEPGLYFIPALIDRWHAEKKFEAFIDYARVDAYRNVGGVRIEDTVLVLEDGQRVLGKPVAKRIEDVEALTCQE